MRNGAFLLFLGLAACGGATTKSSEPASNATPSALTDYDIGKRWAHVTVLTQQQRIFRGADAFFAFTARPTGDAKADATVINAIYRSTDGAAWERVASWPAGGNITDVAYGGGHFVAVGNVHAGGGVATSTDGALWTPFAVQPAGLDAIAYENGHFIAGSTPNDFEVSTDGSTWTPVSRPLMQMTSAAYGNGAYVVFGACGMMTSTDAAAWTDTTPSCASAGASCITPPGGTTPSACAYTQPGFFGAGKFWVMGLSSPDGKAWSPITGRQPTTAYGDYLFDDTSRLDLKAWKDGADPVHVDVDEVSSVEATTGTEPDRVTLAFPNGATCTDHTCVIVGKEMYLLQ